MKLSTSFTFLAIIGTDIVSASDRRKHVRGESSSLERNLQFGAGISNRINAGQLTEVATGLTSILGRKSKSKGKGGKKGKGNKTVTLGECSTICGDATTNRQPVCNAATQETWKSDVGACCCVGGISYLKFVFDTDNAPTSNRNIMGTFTIDANEARSSAFSTIAPAEALTDDWYADADDDSLASRKGSAKGTQENIFIVDCTDECLTDPLNRIPCERKSKTLPGVMNGSKICIVNFGEDNEFNVPDFTLRFPTNTMAYFTADGKAFETNIHTSCSKPAVAPWAAPVMTAGNSDDTPVNLESYSGSDIVLAFEGGISTSYYEGAFADKSTNEAGFELDQDCGCDCGSTPTPEPTFLPTSMGPDISCRPSPAPTEGTRPPTPAPNGDVVLSEKPSAEPTVEPSTMPTFSPTPSPVDQTPEPSTFAPTTSEPTPAPTGTPTSLPSRGPSPAPSSGPSPAPSPGPSPAPSPAPSDEPSAEPSDEPTVTPTHCKPTFPPTVRTNPPTDEPSPSPVQNTDLSPEPSAAPTHCNPTPLPSCNTDDHEPSIPTSDASEFGEASVMFTESSNTCGENSDTSSILDYICSLNNFSLFCSAVTKAGLATLLGGFDVKPSDDIITVYAVINKGMNAAGLTENAIENKMTADALKEILLTHIESGSILADSLACGDQQPTLLGGTYSTMIDCPESANGISTKTISGFFNTNNNRATILTPKDIPLCNGLIQPIDHLIKVVQI